MYFSSSVVGELNNVDTDHQHITNGIHDVRVWRACVCARQEFTICAEVIITNLKFIKNFYSENKIQISINLGTVIEIKLEKNVLISNKHMYSTIK